MIEGWEAKLVGDTQDAERRFQAAKDLAAVRDFRYLSIDKVAELPVEELLQRIEAIRENKAGEPERFRLNSHHQMPGLNTLCVSALLHWPHRDAWPGVAMGRDTALNTLWHDHAR